MNRVITAVQIVIVLAALPAFAAPFEPFPRNQPGVLSAEEIQAATAAMTPLAAGETGFELAASGLQAQGGKFALFAARFARHSDRAEIRSQILCRDAGSGWSCGKSTTARVTKDGVAQEFLWTFRPSEVQAAVDIVDFLYSPCFSSQYAAIGGKPFTPSPRTDPVISVTGPRGFGVHTGAGEDWVFYQLRRADKPADGCGFAIETARIGKSGAILPEAYAIAAKEQEAKNKEQSARDFAQSMRDKQVVEVAMPGSIAVALFALSVPWLCLLISRRAAAGTAGVLTVSATALFAIAEHYYRPGADIRLDLVIIPPLLLLAWLVFIGLSLWQLKKQ